MKNTRRMIIYLLLCFCSVAFFVFLASAEEVIPQADARATTYYSFYLSMDSNGATELATARTKTETTASAIFSVTTITNRTGYPCYINVRNASGSEIAGNAYTIYNNETGPKSFGVRYLSGYGHVGTAYRPSGQTSSNSIYGAYIQGEWHP